MGGRRRGGVAMSALLILALLGPWRLWSGGVPNFEGLARYHGWARAIDKVNRGLGWLTGIAIITAPLYLVTGDAAFGILNGVLGVLYFHGFGHGHVLSYPIPLGTTDPALTVVDAIAPRLAPAPKWWLTAAVRYVVLGVLWLAILDAAAVYLGRPWPVPWLVPVAGVGIIVLYRVFWSLRHRLPYGWVYAFGGVPASDPLPNGYHDGHHVHYVEPLAGWLVAGAIAASLI